jgi:RHS repeat-associated protein
MQNLRTVINYKPFSHFGAFSNKCTKGKKSHLKSDTITYLFAFNGKEKDNETYGEGNAYDFGARIYDSRLGRWMSTDPLSANYPSFSPYNFSINNPIFFIDPDGEDVKPTLFTRIFHRNAYKAFLEVIRTEEGRNLFQDYASKREAKKYWGINKAGAYAHKVDITVSVDNRQKGYGMTNTTMSSIGKFSSIFGLERFSTEKLNGLKDGKTKINIVLGASNNNKFLEFAETIIHELSLHAKNDAAFAQKIYSGELENADQIINEYQLASDESKAGYLSATFQHGAFAVGENSSFNNMVNQFNKSLGKDGPEFEKIVDDDKSIPSHKAEGELYKDATKPKKE